MLSQLISTCYICVTRLKLKWGLLYNFYIVLSLKKRFKNAGKIYTISSQYQDGLLFEGYNTLNLLRCFSFFYDTWTRDEQRDYRLQIKIQLDQKQSLLFCKHFKIQIVEKLPFLCSFKLKSTPLMKHSSRFQVWYFYHFDNNHTYSMYSVWMDVYKQKNKRLYITLFVDMKLNSIKLTIYKTMAKT